MVSPEVYNRDMSPAAVLTLAVAVLAGPQLQKETIDGIRNYTKVDATIGCAGATDPKAMAVLKERGYKAVLNLREATEDGALIPESKAAAEAAGLTFIHVPFKGSAPEDAVADAFLRVVANTSHQPLFINCGSANRVGAMWLIKRMVIDKWPQEKAVEEAKAIGLTSAALEKFALDYVAKRR
jgi:uncharacterized protein (TIGR01244 family)